MRVKSPLEHESEETASDDTRTWLDKEFMQTLLRNNEEDDSIVVNEITVRPAVGKGENYSSVMQRVAVDFTRGGNPESRSLIVKSVPEGELMAKLVAESGMFEREARMYLETVPALCKLQQEHSPDAKIETLAPKTYKTSRPDTIVMEDLRTLGYKMAERHRGLDLQHTTLALRAMARLHALSIALVAREPTSMDFYTEQFYTEEKREINRQFCEPGLKILASIVETWSGFEHFGQKIRNIDLTDRIIELAKVKSDGIVVLNHGDCWLNNMLFQYSESGEVESIKFVDLQIARYNSPAMDILYFMHTSPSPEVREEHWDEVIGEYHKAVVYTLKSVGCESKAFSIEELKKEIKEKMLFGLMTAFLILPIVVVSSEDSPDMSEMIGNAESNNPDQVNFEKIYKGARFRDIFQKMLIRFEQNGLL